MTLHYHGTPITSTATFLTLPGKCFCVSHFRPDQVELAHQIGQSVMLDNGAFSKWKAERKADNSKVYTDWPAYYEWTDRWLDYPTTWAVIPDVIGGNDQEQEALVSEWPHGERGAPVFHLFNDDADMARHRIQNRLLRLLDKWPRVCIGWAEAKLPILGDEYRRAMDLVWNEIAKRHTRTPWVHKLRGMQLSTAEWPFASLDSTDVAQNHNRPHNTARGMADRWDAAQCPPRWNGREPHPDMFEGQAA